MRLPRSSEAEAVAGVPLASMTDLVFLLVAFFLASSTLIDHQRPPLALAESALASRGQQAPDPLVITAERAEGALQVRLGSAIVTDTALAEALSSEGPGAVVELRLAVDLTWAEIGPLLRQLQTAQVGRIEYVGAVPARP